MKQWEAKMLGFTSVWWLVIQPLIEGHANALRSGLAVVCGCVGALAALFVATSEVAGTEPKTSRTIANWFLIGIASLFVVPFVLISLVGLLSLGASLLSH